MTTDSTSNTNIAIYRADNGAVEVRLQGETVWLRQEQMTQLFGRERSVITKHIKNVFAEGELEEKSNVKNLHIADSDKPVKFCNLDVINSVGYRVKSIQSTRFRQWATTVLRQHHTQGYSLNRRRLEANAQELEAALLLVRDLINQTKTSTAPDYRVGVTAADGKMGGQYLNQFQDNEKTLPTILTTSQKLSTGVDARNVRNIVLMRPVNSMIEFNQIIGRGTRQYDGKYYFTIYDFVKAHHLFSDREWDGEPVEPEEPKDRPLPASWQPQDPTTPPEAREREPSERPQKLVVQLADGKKRTIQHMQSTSYWGPDGKPLSPAQFLESLFGALPEFFKNEDELRTLWADPTTRKALLNGLADKGFGREPLREMQRIIEAEKSDLFDVLAYVAFALPPETRASRAQRAKANNDMSYGQKQQAFLSFVLDQYVTQGVDELDAEKLTPLLKLRYNNALNDAMADLGDAVQVRKAFVGMQRYLYDV